MKRDVITRRFAVIALASGFIAVGVAANASTTSTGQFSATCDPIHYDMSSDGLDHYHDASGTVSIKNNGSDRAASVRPYRTVGTALSVLVADPGETKSWSGLAIGYYRVQAEAASAANCNAGLPGNGNFTFKYKITF